MNFPMQTEILFRVNFSYRDIESEYIYSDMNCIQFAQRQLYDRFF